MEASSNHRAGGKGRRRQRALAAVAAAALAAAVFAWAASRLLDSGPALPPDTPGMYRPSSIPGLPHEHVPGASGLIAGALVHINRLGFRGPEITVPKPAGVKRVAVLGDSVVFGQGVGDDGALPAQLESLLNRDHGREGLRFETVNAGVRGYNGLHYPVVLEKLILPLEPDLVALVITEINDPEREPFAPKSEKIEGWGRAWWVKLPLVKNLMAGAYAEEVNRLFVEHVKQLYEPGSPGWAAFVRDLIQVRDLCRERNLPLIAVTFPLLTDDDMFADERRLLQTTLNELGIERVDPRPALARFQAADLVVSPHDFHPNARALAVTAELLAGPVMTRLGLGAQSSDRSGPIIPRKVQ